MRPADSRRACQDHAFATGDESSGGQLANEGGIEAGCQGEIEGFQGLPLAKARLLQQAAGLARLTGIEINGITPVSPKPFFRKPK